MKKKFLQIKEIIDRSQRILIPFHRHPDGDMVGSGLAMAAYLQSLGKDVRVVSVDPADKDWSFLPYFELIEIADPAALNLSEFDLIMFLDSSEVERVTYQEQLKIPTGVKTIKIDHHASKKEDCDLSIVETEKVTGTAQLVLYFLQGIKFTPSREIATLLYMGVLMDSGFFEYGANTISVHADAAKLLKLGAAHEELIFHFKRSTDFNALKFLALGLTNLEVDYENQFCWTTMSYEELAPFRVNSGKDYYHTISGVLGEIQGTEFGIQMVEEKPEFIRCSIRSRQQHGFNSAKLAEEFGGGGHVSASGFTLKMPLREAEDLVLKTARKFAEEYKASLPSVSTPR